VKTSSSLVLLILPTFFLTSCNIYDPFDGPSGDEQILSAARACLDQGDIQCAKDNYAKLSGTKYSDTATAENVFAMLQEQGASMGAFIKAINGGDVGAGMTLMAEELASGAGLSKRQAILAAWKQNSSIQSTNMKNLVRFVSSFALVAEILAESSTGNTLHKTDIAPQACQDPQGAGCASCTNARNLSDVATVSVDASTTYTGTTNLGELNGAIVEAQSALTAIGGAGSFSSGALNFVTQLTGTAGGGTNVAAVANCYRKELLTLNVGR
jgi:hypothetical protein